MGTLGVVSDLAIQLSESGRDWLIHKPVDIAIYLILGLAVRFLFHRAIDRLFLGAKRTDQAGSRRRSFFLRRTPDSVETEDGLGERERRSSAVRTLRGRAQDPARDARRRKRRAQRAQTLGSVLKSAVSFLVLVWVVLQSLAILGVNVAPFIASAGIVGVALGFGAQNLVRDFITGIFMLFEDQYGVGDVVDVGDAVGTVESVGLRITTVRDLQGTLWYVRNGGIARVGNFSQDYAVAFLQIPVAYSADVDLACRVALEAAQETVADDALRNEIIGAPEMLGVDGITADAISLRLTVAVRANAQWAVERELRRRILIAFDENGIRPLYLDGLSRPADELLEKSSR
ncbi:mechanosensitive ion channel family protein [Mycobacteroides saopaulense]|uniref:Mechanosensitive ion channel protein n=1 Tax=Mycobacteroides saopaulense TaxID=1578165 RepID=A0ABX3BYU9_9MYCO|nr:mechanosensitive ion channel domain-containing protein [Mycobacteroides saopaulense]OHT87047.1 mechanosensitive ion channel protein [Mycobacteroides saopaulense]OHU08904.1 mechanosensitive ion channel protein [Mycobacteroides saopaulense]